MGRELCRVEDELGTIVVTQRGDKRVLSFGTPMEQSNVLMSKPHYLNHEYTQMMLLALLFVDARRVYLMGLGGGGLVHCLHHFFPQMNIQVAELRQAVIDIAYQWFDLPADERVGVTHSDARRFLAAQQSASGDIVFSDLYDASGMSELQGHQAYISDCYRVLDDHGWLVLNFHKLPEDDSPLLHTLFDLFAELYVCHASKGNWIVFCGKSPCAFDSDVLKQRAEALVQKVQMPLMYHYRRLQPLRPGLRPGGSK
jgi:spermidine synthase